MKVKYLFILLLPFISITFMNCDKDDGTVTGYNESELNLGSLYHEGKQIFDNDIKIIFSPDIETLKNSKAFNQRQNLTPDWNETSFNETSDTYVMRVPLLAKHIQSMTSTAQYWDDSLKIKFSRESFNLKSSLIFIKDKNTDSHVWYVESSLHPQLEDQKITDLNKKISIISDNEGFCYSLKLRGKKLPLRNINNQSLEILRLNDDFRKINVEFSLSAADGNQTKTTEDPFYMFQCEKHGYFIDHKFPYGCPKCIEEEKGIPKMCGWHGDYTGKNCPKCNNICSKHTLLNCYFCSEREGEKLDPNYDKYNYPCSKCGVFVWSTRNDLYVISNEPILCTFCAPKPETTIYPGSVNDPLCPDAVMPGHMWINRNNEVFWEFCPQIATDYFNPQPSNNCHCYIVCDHGGRVKVERCFEGLVWDPNLLICNYPFEELMASCN